MDEKPSSTQGPAAEEEDVEILHLDLPPWGLRDEIWAGSVRLSSVRPTEEDKAGKQVTLCLPAVPLYIPEPQDLGTGLGAVIRAAGEAAASRASSPAPTPNTRDTPPPTCAAAFREGRGGRIAGLLRIASSRHALLTGTAE